MSYKPTATVGPTVTGSASAIDKNAIDYQLMNVMEKTIALQQFADKLRNEKFLAKKRMQMKYAASEFSPVTSSSTPPIRCSFVKASKALTVDCPSPSSVHGLNVDAPSFMPSMYSSPYNYVTPPSTPTNSLIAEKFSSPTVVDRPYFTGIHLLAQQQQRVAKIGNTNRSLSTSDVDEYEKNTTRGFDTSNGSSSKRAFYSSYGSAVTTPESLHSDLGSNDDSRDDFHEASYGQRTSGPNHFRLKQPQFNDAAEYRYDRNEMLKIKDDLEANIVVSRLRDQLPDEFLNDNGVWSPDLWIKSIWKKEAEIAGVENEAEYFRARIPSKTTWGNGAPGPGYIRRSASLR